MAIYMLAMRQVLAGLVLTSLSLAGCAAESGPEAGDTSSSPSPQPEPDVLDAWPENLPFMDIFPEFPEEAFVYSERVSETTGSVLVTRYAGLGTATGDDVDEAVEFLLSSLPESGWTVTRHSTQGTSDSEFYAHHLEFEGHDLTGQASVTVMDQYDQTAEETTSRPALSISMRLENWEHQSEGIVQQVPMPRWWDEAVPPAPEGWGSGLVSLRYGAGRSVPIDATEVETEITLDVKFSEEHEWQEGDEWERTTEEADALLETAAEYYRSTMPQRGWTLVSDEDTSEKRDDGWGDRRQELVFSGFRSDLTVLVHYPFGPDVGPTNWVDIGMTFQAAG